MCRFSRPDVHEFTKTVGSAHPVPIAGDQRDPVKDALYITVIPPPKHTAGPQHHLVWTCRLHAEKNL